jgi:hypothetical protein
MTTSQFDDLLTGRTPMDRTTLQELVLTGRRYPYFEALRMLYLRNLAEVGSVRYADEVRRSAVYLPDRVRLFAWLDRDEYAWSRLLRQDLEQSARHAEPETDSFDLIDTFLEQSSDEPYPEGLDDLLPAASPVAPPADYVSTLLEQPDLAPDAEPDAGMQLIDSFIAKEEKEGMRLPLEQPAPEPAKPSQKEDSLMGEESFLTESLAKIYIKQKKYSKALEIIKKLSLKYPEKNVYFADQIRFLEKIITNIKPE